MSHWNANGRHRCGPLLFQRCRRGCRSVAELAHHARRAREAGKTARTGALLVVVLILAAFWAGYMGPTPEAHGAPRPASCIPQKSSIMDKH